ncbi:outer membrane porin OpcP [Caballeronia sordidicola]|uniref:Outer membrane porin OpcP n=1 Tax=Caballeronia sordidicola TaxID=196367 RepID=A0A158I177_CABSO|nr:porin [Caballeronia sordidicola]SAL49881.1 outer membrane porin OpcP [Caballeronia sordidicola]
MQKKIIALAVLGASIGVAHAQSSVTLYGLFDLGVNYTSNSGGKPQFNMSSGEQQGSRFGLKGLEDLGGGLKAIFLLENGFTANNGAFGQGGALWGRQAFVGLSNNRYGTVTLGRQYDSVAEYVAPFAAPDQWAGGVFAHAGDLDNENNNARTNNAIKYTSPELNGLAFGGMYSFGGVAGSVSRNQIFSGGLHYVSGSFRFAAAYLNIRDPNISYFGSNPNGISTGVVTNMADPIFSGYASASTQQTFSTALAYVYRATTFGLVYSRIKFSGLGNPTAGPIKLASGKNATPGTSGTFNNIESSLMYQFTPAFFGNAAYDYTNESGIGRSHYHTAAVGLDYFLSKRTDIYFLAVYQRAVGTNSQGVAAVAALNSLTASSSDKQTYIRISLRHKF